MIRSLTTATVVLALSGAAIDAEQPDQWRLVPELRIGSIDNGPYALSRVGDLTIGPGGEIFVAQPMEGAIRVYGPDGEYIRSIGREGSGPGEFRRLDRIGWMDGSLWATDRTQHRISFFQLDGTHVESRRIASPVVKGTGFPAGPSGLFSDGTVLGIPRESRQTVESGDPPQLPYLRLSRSGSILNPIGSRDYRGDFYVVRTEGFAGNLRGPVAFSTLHALSPDGEFLTIVDRPEPDDEARGRIRLSRLAPTGDTLSTRTFRYRAQELDRRELNVLLDRYREWLVDSPFASSNREADRILAETFSLPRYQPEITDVVVSDEHQIWLRGATIGVSDVRWRVIDASDELIAEVRVPEGIELLYVRGDTAWGVEHDEFDVPYVVRFRIERGE